MWISKFWAAVLATVLLVSQAALADPPTVHWQLTLDAAKRIAAQNNQLVLIHFWAPWCVYCRRMEQEVLAEPGVASILQANYVPVKLNAEYFPNLAQQYGATALPTDVIITPQGQMVQRFQGLQRANEFAAQLNQIAMTSRPRPEALLAQIPSGPAAAGGPAAPVAPSGPPAAAANPNPPYAADFNRPIPGVNTALQGNPPTPGAAAPAGSGVVAGQVAPSPANQPGAAANMRPSPASQVPPGVPPVGLDGFCPVRLQESRQWVAGDPRYGVIHRDRTYLCAGPDERRQFLENPDFYAPVLSGADLVLAIDRHEMVNGTREHGGFYHKRVYLFTSEDTLARFKQDPERYLQAMQQTFRPLEGDAGRR